MDDLKAGDTGVLRLSGMDNSELDGEYDFVAKPVEKKVIPVKEQIRRILEGNEWLRRRRLDGDRCIIHTNKGNTYTGTWFVINNNFTLDHDLEFIEGEVVNFWHPLGDEIEDEDLDKWFQSEAYKGGRHSFGALRPLDFAHIKTKK